MAAPDAVPDLGGSIDIDRSGGEAVGLIVRYTSGTLPTQGGEVTGADGLSVQMSAGENIGRGLRTIEFDEVLSAEAALEAAAQLEQSPLVLEAHPNYLYYPTDVVESIDIAERPAWPVTTQTSATWGLDRIDQTSATLDSTYTYDSTGDGVTAYIVDTGISPTHTEFTGRIESGFHLSRFTSSGDCHGHGTHVAGTVGGTTYGVAKQVTLVPVRIFGCVITGTTSVDLLQALQWIINDHQAGEPAVVNMSLGGPADTIVNTAVQLVINDGMTVVAGSGNDAVLSCTVSPASAPNAITVNASTSANTNADFSNYGSCSDIYAPGAEILSAYFAGDTLAATASGTSMAAPHVSGVVARILSDDPTLTPAQVWQRVQADATPFTSTRDASANDADLMLYAPYYYSFTNPPIPFIVGSTVGGSTMTADTPSWVQTVPDPDVDPDLSVQWNRSGVPIPGATDGTYDTTPADVGHTLTVTFTASAPGWATLSRTSLPTAVITQPMQSPPDFFSVTPLAGAIGVEWYTPVQFGGTLSDYIVQYRPASSSTYLTFADGVGADSYSTTITGLVRGSSYYVRVAATTEFGTSPFTEPALVTTLSGITTAPTALSATPAPRSVQLDWWEPETLNDGAITDYVIRYRATGTTTWLPFADGMSVATTATVTGLSGSRSYDFAVQAKTAFGTSSSAVITRSTLSGLASLPTALAGTASTTTMALTWGPPSTTNGGVITDYIVKFRRTGATTWVTVNDGVSPSTGATVAGLTRGISYEFAVAPKTAFGTSPSAILKKSTLTGLPAAPTALTGTATTTSMQLDWVAPSTTNGGGVVTDYVIRYRATGATTWITVNDGVGTATTRTITGLTRGKSYEFVVNAKTVIGTGASVLIKKSTLSGRASAPTGLAAPTRTAKTIALTWNAPTATNGGTITDYIVRYRVAGTTTWVTFADGVSTTTSATITGLTRTKAYDVNVYARTLAGSTTLAGSSTTLRVSTLSGAPSQPTVFAEGIFTTSLLIDVAAVADPAYPITSYTVQYRLDTGSGPYVTYPQSLPATGGLLLIEGLGVATAYELRVTATSAGGTSTPRVIYVGTFGASS